MTLGVQEEFNWGANANCYSYAADCPNPVVSPTHGTAVPGGASGQRPANNGNVAQLHAGILADGGAAVAAIAGNPAAIPAPPANSYLIAMLTSATGFHFIRRDEYTKRWSWKDANHGSVKLNVMHFPSDRYVYVNDSNLNDILVANRGNYVWAYNLMTFQGFYTVTNGGFAVAG